MRRIKDDESQLRMDGRPVDQFLATAGMKMVEIGTWMTGHPKLMRLGGVLIVCGLAGFVSGCGGVSQEVQATSIELPRIEITTGATPTPGLTVRANLPMIIDRAGASESVTPAFFVTNTPRWTETAAVTTPIPNSPTIRVENTGTATGTATRVKATEASTQAPVIYGTNTPEIKATTVSPGEEIQLTDEQKALLNEASKHGLRGMVEFGWDSEAEMPAGFVEVEIRSGEQKGTTQKVLYAWYSNGLWNQTRKVGDERTCELVTAEGYGLQLVIKNFQDPDPKLNSILDKAKESKNYNPEAIAPVVVVPEKGADCSKTKYLDWVDSLQIGSNEFKGVILEALRIVPEDLAIRSLIASSKIKKVVVKGPTEKWGTINYVDGDTLYLTRASFEAQFTDGSRQSYPRSFQVAMVMSLAAHEVGIHVPQNRMISPGGEYSEWKYLNRPYWRTTINRPDKEFQAYFESLRAFWDANLKVQGFRTENDRTYQDHLKRFITQTYPQGY